MKNFNFRGTDFKIIDEFDAHDPEEHFEYEVKETDRTIIKKKFTFFPICVDDNISWLQNERIRYRLYFERKKYFDDGLTYQYFWDVWRPSWKPEKIIK